MLGSGRTIGNIKGMVLAAMEQSVEYRERDVNKGSLDIKCIITN